MKAHIATHVGVEGGLVQDDILDEPEHITRCRLEAQKGDVTAQHNMGHAYNNGRDVPKDFEEAAKWWTMAAEQGDVRSILPLGQLYRFGDIYHLGDGEFVTFAIDYDKAFEWYKVAASKGKDWGAGIAQNKLGEMYSIGDGRLQDYVMAHMWFNIASANGDEDGRKNRDAVAKNMTAEDISKATAMARECMKSDYKKCGY